MSTPIDRLNKDLDNLYNIKALLIETVEDLLAIYSVQKVPLGPLDVSLGLSWMH